MRPALFFMLLSVPLAIWQDSYNFTYIKEIMLSTGFLLLFIAFIRAKEIQISTKSMYVFIIPAWMLLSFSFSSYRGAVIPVMCAAFMLSLIFIIMANQNAVSKERLSLLILLSALPVAAIGLGQVFLPGMFSGLLAFNRRIPSTLGNPNFFAAYLIVLIPFILTAPGKFTRVKPAYAAAVVVLVLFLLYKTGSKGAFAALACEMAVFAVITRSKHADMRDIIRNNALPVIIAAAAVIAGVIMLLHNIDPLRFRVNVWAGTIKLIAANPVLGSGPGSFTFIFPAFRPGEIMKQSYMHSYEVSYPENFLLQAAAEYGISGLAALVFVLFTILRGVEPEKKDFYAAFCGLLAVNLVGVDINFGTSAMLSAVLAGTLLNGRKGGSIVISPAWKKAVIITVPVISVLILVLQFKVQLSDIYLKRAIAMSEAKQWQASIENYKKALIYNAGNVPAGYFLASAYYDSGPETNAPAAIAKLEEVERLAPDYVLLHYKKAVILNSMGRQTEAIAEYGKMLKIDPYLKPALAELAYIYYKNGDLALAGEYMERAAEKSNDPALYNNLGNIYFMQKRVDEAVAAYKKAIEIKPDKDYYYNLGCVYFTLNDIINAKTNIYKAAEIDSKNRVKEAKIENMVRLIKQYERVTRR